MATPVAGPPELINVWTLIKALLTALSLVGGLTLYLARRWISHADEARSQLRNAVNELRIDVGRLTTQVEVLNTRMEIAQERIGHLGRSNDPESTGKWSRRPIKGDK